MSVSYRKLISILSKKGYSLNSLVEKGVITDFSSRKISKGEHIDLKHIDSICQFLNLPIEDVVEIIHDEDE